MKLKDLPEHLRHKIEDAIHKGDGQVISKEERTIVHSPPENAPEENNILSLEKVLTLLSGMKVSFSSGHMELGVFQRMVVDIIKDYISPLADSIQLEFVVNGILDSELYDYLNDKMLNDLRAYVISSISENK